MTDDEDFKSFEQELAAKRRIEPSPSPPATPTPPPQPVGTNSQMMELLNTMRAIDEMKLAFMKTEMEKQRQMEETITARIRQSMESASPARDPLEEAAYKYLFDLAANAFRGQPAPLPPAPLQSTPPMPIAQPAPQESVAQTEGDMIPQSQIDTIANEIDDHFPQECKDARSGKVSKDDAIAKLKAGGVPAYIVERVYLSIMDIEDEPEPTTETPATNGTGL